MASRLVPPATAFAATSRASKRQPIRKATHFDFIRSLPCVITGSYQRVEAAHVSEQNYAYGHLGRGKSQKADDVWILPLCAEQHALQHHMGDESQFWSLAGIDPYRTAAALFIASGDRDTALLIIQHAKDKQ